MHQNTINLSIYFKFSLLLCTFILQGCKVGPDYVAPSVDLPTSFSNHATPKTVGKITLKWWEEYKDTDLNSLIDESLSANADLLIAMNNLSKARAELRLGQSYLLPHIDLQASAVKTKASKNLPSQGRNLLTKDTSINGIATYEIDLWGKVSRANEAARATILSALSNVKAVQLAVAVDIANIYFNMITLNEKIQLAKQLIAIEQELLILARAQVHYGTIHDISLNSVISALALSEASLPLLEQELQEQITALAILLGKSPKTIIDARLERIITMSSLSIPATSPDILPSELLTRRPDIVAAEENLKSSNAMIGVAKAAYFPSFSLSALVGLSSSSIDKLLSKHSRTYEITKNIVLPIFDFGAAKANLDIAKLDTDQAMIKYALIVRTAFGDVANALKRIDSANKNHSAAKKNEEAIVRVLQLTNQLYKYGKIAYTEVLTVKKNMIQANINKLDAKLLRAQASISLFQAMGGGW